LRPVDDIAAAAHEIGQTQDLGRRLATHREDELGTLVESLNGMLDRLQRARDELERTLEGQRRFLADVSHELRTPLTTVRGNLEVTLRDSSMPADDRKAAIADALGEAERMSRMVEDLLELARTGVARDARREPVELGRLVESAVESARSRSGVVPIGCAVRDAPVVAGDKDQLRRLVDNLLDNAAKYTTAGEVRVEAVCEDGSAVVRVSDTGPGMTPDETAHAFERFWRGERARGEPGSGLGLAIARAVAEGHGGTITLDSSPGAGTTVTVRLPRALMPLSDAPVRNEAEVGR
jgi:signal transduction histidine kinase